MDIVMSTAKGDELRMRIISDPDPALKILLQRMHLRLPKRLSQSRNVVEKMLAAPKENQ